MGYQDRPYYRDSGSGASNPLTWVLYGSVPLFTAFEIRVRAHASMFLYVGLVLIFGLGEGFYWQDRVQSMTMLFAIVLLHEFGHCFAARWVGGDADEIIMHPLGGLALARPPHRPLATFITVAAGPAVNVIICLICGIILWSIIGWVPWDPIRPHPIGQFHSWFSLIRWTYWIYLTSWFLLLFNLLPIFPLDGGQMVQAALWPWVGYFKSMLFACVTGMIGAALVLVVGLARIDLFLMLLAVMGFYYCFQFRRALLAQGPEEYSDTTDYSAAYEQPEMPRRQSRRAAKRALKIARAQRMERARIDQILAKVSAEGMQSLTWLEKRALRKATQHQRQREMTAGRSRRL